MPQVTDLRHLRYVGQQVAGQTKAAMREAKQIEARLLEEVGAGRHKGSRSQTMTELLERWLEWRPTVRPIAPTTVSSYRAAMDRYILPSLGKLGLPGRLGHRPVALDLGLVELQGIAAVRAHQPVTALASYREASRYLPYGWVVDLILAGRRLA
jgi:hypothetical protein